METYQSDNSDDDSISLNEDEESSLCNGNFGEYIAKLTSQSTIKETITRLLHKKPKHNLNTSRERLQDDETIVIPEPSILGRELLDTDNNSSNDTDPEILKAALDAVRFEHQRLENEFLVLTTLDKHIQDKITALESVKPEFDIML